MSRSFINLRRALFGTSCAIVFGFGATQALAGAPQMGVNSQWACRPYPIELTCTCEDGGVICVSPQISECPIC
jgi:hypothetical protein